MERRRIRASPNIANSEDRPISAHSERVGMEADVQTLVPTFTQPGPLIVTVDTSPATLPEL